jgi:hypothetical protein
MMRGASGDECGKLLGQEYNRPAEAGVLKKPREATLTLTLVLYREIIAVCSQFHTKHINILCGQNVEFVSVKPGVA